MPIYIKEGAIIPKFPIQQYVGEKDIKEVNLDVYYKEGQEVSQLFSDAQDGYDYTKGRYSLRNFKLTGREKELIINQFKEGKYDTDYDEFKIVIHGLPFEIGEIQVDNEVISLEHLKVNNTYTMTVCKNFSELHFIAKEK